MALKSAKEYVENIRVDENQPQEIPEKAKGIDVENRIMFLSTQLGNFKSKCMF